MTPEGTPLHSYEDERARFMAQCPFRQRPGERFTFPVRAFAWARLIHRWRKADAA